MKENSIEDRIEEKYTRYLNCETDTLELTIEEAIFILETDESLYYVEDLLQEAYKVILSDYKRVLKENEELKAENEYNKLLLDTNKNFTIDKKNGNYKWNVIEIQKIKDNIKELDNVSYAEELEDIMNRKNYTITELVQYVLKQLLDGNDTNVGSI